MSRVEQLAQCLNDSYEAWTSSLVSSSLSLPPDLVADCVQKLATTLYIQETKTQEPATGKQIDFLRRLIGEADEKVTKAVVKAMNDNGVATVDDLRNGGKSNKEKATEIIDQILKAKEAT